MPPGSRLDHVYRSILMTRFFTKGWGKPDNLKRLFAFRKIVSNRDVCFNLVSKDYPISIIKEETYSDCKILEGQFLSPFVTHLPGLLPKEAEIANFQVVLPRKWNSEHYKPICLHLAGTGDHGFWRRRQIMAKPLLKSAGIGSILLENPFYGLRKPKDQVRSSLHNVSDIFVMGGCLILESLALFHWCERFGLGPLGITGMSMGGHMASLAATNWPKPIVLVPCLSWSTASPVFTQGVMSESINWDLLQSQYYSDGVYRHEIKKMVCTEEDAFRAGQHFAKYYPESMDHIFELNKESKISKSKIGVTMSPLPCSANESKVSVSTSSSGGIGVKPQSKAQTEKSSYNQETSQTDDATQMLTLNSRTLQSESTSMTPPDLMCAIGDPNAVNNKILADVKVLQAGIIPEIKNIKTTNTESSTMQDANETNSCSPSNSLKSQPSTFSLNFSLLSHFNESKSKLMRLRGKTEPTNSSKKSAKSGVDETSQGKLAKWRDRESLQFMRGIMDECTHLRNFEVPMDTSLIIAVCAKDDAYVPRDGCADLTDIWPGAEVRYLEAGHVSAYVLYQHMFRGAIVDSFDRMKKKYYTD